MLQIHTLSHLLSRVGENHPFKNTSSKKGQVVSISISSLKSYMITLSILYFFTRSKYRFQRLTTISLSKSEKTLEKKRNSNNKHKITLLLSHISCTETSSSSLSSKSVVWKRWQPERYSRPVINSSETFLTQFLPAGVEAYRPSREKNSNQTKMKKKRTLDLLSVKLKVVFLSRPFIYNKARNRMTVFSFLGKPGG